jgi:hypothetical protein
MNFEIFQSLVAGPDHDHVAVNHGPEQERDADLAIDASTENAMLFSTPAEVG